MSSLDSILNRTGLLGTQVYEATVARDVLPGEGVLALVGGFSLDHLFGPMPYPLRVDQYPEEGDRVLVALTEDRAVWCVAWDRPVVPAPLPASSLYVSPTPPAGNFAGNLSATSAADLTGYSGSYTGTGRDVLVHFQATITCVADAAVRTWLKVDATDIPGRFFYVGIPTVSTTMTQRGVVRVPALAAGAHTFQVRYVCNVGGNTLYNDYAAGVGDSNRAALWAYDVM